MHDRLHTVTIAPMTTASRPAGYRIGVHFQGKDGLIVLDHIRSVDKSRLVKHLGAVDPLTLSRTLARLRDMFED